MPQLTIISTVDGYVRSDSTVYATAAASYVAGTSNSGGSTFITGQQFNGTTYFLHQGFVRWPLTGIPTGANIIAASVRITNSGSPAGSRRDTYFRDYDPGTSVTTADYRDQSTLSGLSLFATMPTANNGSNTTYTLTGTAALITKIQSNIGGNIGAVVVSDGQVTSTAPTGDERWTFQSLEDVTDADRPALIVDYLLPGSFTAVLG